MYTDYGPEAWRNGFIYGDFCSGDIWLAFPSENDTVTQHLVDTDNLLVGFGQGLEGPPGAGPFSNWMFTRLDGKQASHR